MSEIRGCPSKTLVVIRRTSSWPQIIFLKLKRLNKASQFLFQRTVFVRLQAKFVSQPIVEVSQKETIIWSFVQDVQLWGLLQVCQLRDDGLELVQVFAQINSSLSLHGIVQVPSFSAFIDMSWKWRVANTAPRRNSEWGSNLWGRISLSRSRDCLWLNLRGFRRRNIIEWFLLFQVCWVAFIGLHERALWVVRLELHPKLELDVVSG